MQEDREMYKSTILLAHPDEAYALEYQALLEKSGHTILTTSNIDNFDSEAFHTDLNFLFIDDGFLRDELNTFIGIVTFTFPDIRIALFCKRIDEELLHFYNRLQVFTFLAKPLDEKKLLDFVKINTASTISTEAAAKIRHVEGLEAAINDNFIISKASKDGTITFVNQNFCDLTGFDPEDMIGQSYSLIGHPDTTIDVKEELWDTILSKRVFRKRIQNRTKLEDDFIVDLTIIPILNDYDEITEYLCIMQDVSDLVNLNQHMMAEKEAHTQELNVTKDFYLQVFSHELKTPLNSIINFSSYVSKQLSKSEIEKKEKLLESLALVEQSGNDVFDMVNALLDLNKIKDGKLSVETTECFVNVIIKRVEKKFAFLIKEESIDVTYRYDEAKSFVCDFDKVVQIVNALFSNAIKYGNGKIYLEIVENDDSFDMVLEDDGLGIDNKEEVVELFTQGDSDAMTREAKGAGIGLHYVFVLAQLMGGSLLIEDSKRLGGAKVTCKLPLVKGEE